MRSRPRGRLQCFCGGLFPSLFRFEGGGDFCVEGGEVFGGADGEAAEDFQQRIDVGAGDVEGGHSQFGAGIGASGIELAGIDGHDPVGGKFVAEDFAVVRAPDAGGLLVFLLRDGRARGEDSFEERDGLGGVVEGHAVVGCGETHGFFGAGFHHGVERVKGLLRDRAGAGHLSRDYRSREARPEGTEGGSPMYL